MPIQKPTAVVDQQLPDDISSMDTQVLSQCAISEPQAWLQTQIAEVILPHLIANHRRLTPEYVQKCFAKLKIWEKLTIQQWSDMLALAQDPANEGLLRRWVGKNIWHFVTIINSSKYNDETNDITIKPQDQLFYDNGEYIWFAKIVQYIKDQTEWIQTDPKIETQSNTPSAITKLRTQWVDKMQIWSPETRKLHKENLDVLIAGDAEGGSVWFESVDGIDDLACRIMLPWYTGKFCAPKITPGQDTKEFYYNVNYQVHGAWNDFNNRNDIDLKAMKDGKKQITNSADWKIASDVAPYMNAGGMKMMSEGRLNECLDAIGAYLDTDSKDEQISAWMYLTGNYGLYWMSDLNSDASDRRFLYSHCDDCWFSDLRFGDSYCGLLLWD